MMPTKRSKRPLRAKKPKKTMNGTKRLYEVPVTAWMRYKHPIQKGVYWYFFSRAVRVRDVARFGTCISCDRPITLETSDCGHFIPASQCGRDLLFDKRNNNAECNRCNAWDELHLIGYAKGLDKRYGEGTAEELLKRHREYKFGPPVKDWNAKEYDKLITELRVHGL